MKIIKIDKEKWVDGLGNVGESYRLFGPKKENTFFSFKALEKGELPDFSFSNTRLSPKSLVYPQSEAMLEYTLDETRDDHHLMKAIDKDYSPRAVIGIRPCDAKAFLLVKKNFDAADYKDPYWTNSYEATTWVGFACTTPCITCFCTSAGCGPFHEEGLDLLLVDAGDHFFAKVVTSKGENLIHAAGWGAEADADSAMKQIQALQEKSEAKITATICTNKLKDISITALFDASFWERVSFSCINCGTCTYVCPTCWCFDIQDEVYGNSGMRMRNWDSCMYPLFTLHGSGHNPRDAKHQRVRQRFMHKLKYYPEKYENGIQCVGCGRCIRSCPVNIDIRSVCEWMNSYDPAA